LVFRPRLCISSRHDLPAPLSVLSAIVWTAVFTVIGHAFSEFVASAGDTATRIALAGTERLPEHTLRWVAVPK
jgi:hypothetical protein